VYYYDLISKEVDYFGFYYGLTGSANLVCLFCLYIEVWGITLVVFVHYQWCYD